MKPPKPPPGPWRPNPTVPENRGFRRRWWRKPPPSEAWERYRELMAENTRLAVEIVELRQALGWVLTHDYRDTTVPPREIADTMATAMHLYDGSESVTDD